MQCMWMTKYLLYKSQMGNGSYTMSCTTMKEKQMTRWTQSKPESGGYPVNKATWKTSSSKFIVAHFSLLLLIITILNYFVLGWQWCKYGNMALSPSIVDSVTAMHPLSMLSATVIATVLSHDLHHLGSLKSPWKCVQGVVVVLSGRRHSHIYEAIPWEFVCQSHVLVQCST